MIREVPEGSRYEIKFVASESEQDRLIQWLKLHPANFYIPYPDRWVNNVYFDTHHYFAYNENLSGSSSRTKVRYRWYGESDFPQAGSLEVKIKRNFFGWKQRFRAKDSPYEEGNYWQDIRKNLVGQLGSNAKHWLDANPHQTIMNRYYRQYFVTRDEKVRVTIDTQQSVYDQRYKPYPNTLHRTNIPQTLILEVKFDRCDRHYASQIIQGLQLRVSRNSKYMVSMKALNGF